MDCGGGGNPLAPWLQRYIPLGICCCGYVKDQVFRPKIGSVKVLRARINNSVASVTPQMLESTWSEIGYSLDILRVTNGAHI
jgi:hypothetical protein